MVLQELPPKFELYNQYSTKNIAVVVEIEGLDLLSNVAFGTKIRYGDPDLHYGDGFVYGGLRPVDGQRNILSLDGSLTISQKIEPEQGRGAISTISMTFIDLEKYMTRACSPGVILDDILGKRVKVWMGYQQLSYPEEYFVIYRGIITSAMIKSGLCTLKFSDANIKRKDYIFYTATTTLDTGIDAVQTTIPVISNLDFHKKITGPDGSYFTGVSVFLQIDDEIIEYQQTGQEGVGFGVNSFVNVLRGQRGTVAAAHDPAAPVSAGVVIQDHGIDMALRHMLSGMNGFFKEDIDVQAFVSTGSVLLGDVPGAIVLPDGADAQEDDGINVGDYVTITGATNPANNITAKVLALSPLFDQPNRLIRTDGAFVAELNSPAFMAVRSQYDVYPITCGSKLSGEDVDVITHVQLKNTFLSAAENTFRIPLTTEQQSCKTWLESQVYLPMAAYSLTKFGRLSMGYTKPPIADQRFNIIDKTNILNPAELAPVRATDNRKFFNQIDYYYDAYDDGSFATTIRSFDSESLSVIGISSTLPIKSVGSRTDLGFDLIKDRRIRFFLQRYRKSALMLQAIVNWGIGVQIEAGDVIALRDDGFLQIANFGTGDRNLGTQLFEVVGRTLQVKDGKATLDLLGGVSGDIVDRYATIAPSSLIDIGTTTTRLRIKNSFGDLFNGDEIQKWKDYIGTRILVHSPDFSISGITAITALDPSDSHAFFIDPPLGFTPSVDDIIDLAPYSDSADPAFEALVKQVHVFLDPQILVASGISNTQFTVAPGDEVRFFVGAPVLVHNFDYSVTSSDGDPTLVVTDVTGVTITVSRSLGFTPSAGQFVDLIGFNFDKSQPYRFV